MHAYSELLSILDIPVSKRKSYFTNKGMQNLGIDCIDLLPDGSSQ